jgi:hypothetical protein
MSDLASQKVVADGSTFAASNKAEILEPKSSANAPVFRNSLNPEEINPKQQFIWQPIIKQD